MADYTDIDYYNDLVQSFGKPEYTIYPTQNQIDYWQKYLPELFLRYWIEEGWGSLSDGQYWVCNPDQLRPVIEEIFNGDPELDPKRMIPIGYNALGMIDIFWVDQKTINVDLVFGTVTIDDPQEEYPETDFIKIYSRVTTGAHRFEWKDENDIPIFEWALKNLGPLQPGEIYGFVPAYSVTGNYPVRNLQKVPLVEHLVMLASLSPPTLYDYVMPEDGEPGFGTLIPRRKVGPQP